MVGLLFLKLGPLAGVGFSLTVWTFSQTAATDSRFYVLLLAGGSLVVAAWRFIVDDRAHGREMRSKDDQINALSKERDYWRDQSRRRNPPKGTPDG